MTINISGIKAQPSIYLLDKISAIIGISNRNEHLKTALEAMRALICASNATFSVSNINPWKPKIHGFYPRTIENVSFPPSTLKPHANAKGFSGTPSRIGVDDDVAINKSKKNNDDGDDEIPQEVFNRMIFRILVAVGVPMALGLAFLHIFGVLKEQQIWDVPRWLPFLTTLTTFGASTLGIACVWGTFYKFGGRERRIISWAGRSSEELGSDVEGRR